MRTSVTKSLCLGAALVLSTAAFAKLAVPNDILGKVEGALDTCAQLDPSQASKYQEHKKALTQGASEDEIAAARASQEYKDGYEAGTKEMKSQPKEQTKKQCAAALEGK